MDQQHWTTLWSGGNAPPEPRLHCGEVSFAWDAGSVLPWRLVSDLLTIDSADGDTLTDVYAWIDEESTSEREAVEMHYLRGLFLGQAAEAEAASLALADVVARDHDDRNNKRRTFSGALQLIRKHWDTRGGEGQCTSVIPWLGHLEWLRSRRNQLVHAHLRVGVARQHDRAPLEPVISYFHEVQYGQEVDWSLAPRAAEEADDILGSDSPEIDEQILRWDIWRAREATCSAARLGAVLAP